LKHTADHTSTHVIGVFNIILSSKTSFSLNYFNNGVTLVPSWAL